MKKATKKDAPRQRRRERALVRFRVDPDRMSKDKDYAKRKLDESLALHKALGLA